ncbi:MAG: hypothetical protein C4306_09100 [Thermoleophilia bacterium]
MPEGDTIRAAANALRLLEGEVLQVEAVHPRAVALGIATRLDRRRLDQVDAVGKNLFLVFQGGLLLRSHLRLHGRWEVRAAGDPVPGRPWLVLRGRSYQAILWNGPVLGLDQGPIRRRIGPDIMADPPDIEAMVTRLRSTDQRRFLGEALLDQRLVAGIGNRWRAEALHSARLSPWLRLHDLLDEELTSLLASTSAAMRAGRERPAVYRRAGRPCRRCGTVVSSAPQGEAGRTVYWCPNCQQSAPSVTRPPAGS